MQEKQVPKEDEQLRRLERLNQLANREKAGETLSDAEKREQATLREEYRLAFRAAFRGVLENTYIQQPDGTRRRLKRKDG